MIKEEEKHEQQKNLLTYKNCNMSETNYRGQSKTEHNMGRLFNNLSLTIILLFILIIFLFDVEIKPSVSFQIDQAVIQDDFIEFLKIKKKEDEQKNYYPEPKVSIDVASYRKKSKKIEEQEEEEEPSTKNKLTPTQQKNLCHSTLSHGHWQKSITNHTRCSYNPKCRRTAWIPKTEIESDDNKKITCSYKLYNQQDVFKCFSNKNLLFIGDSRGRQLFRAVENRLDGNLILVDNVEHHQVNRSFDNFDDSEEEIFIRWEWLTKLPYLSSYQARKSNAHNLDLLILPKYYPDQNNWKSELPVNDRYPDILIFNSLFLHSTRACPNSKTCNERFTDFKQVIKKIIIPHFKEILNTKPNTKIVWLGTEDVSSKSIVKTDSNGVRYEQQLFLEEIIRTEFADEKYWRRINFIGASDKIAYAGEKKFPDDRPLMSSDGTHLMERRVNTTIPDTLWAEANLLFNFVCNDEFVGEEENLCCA